METIQKTYVSLDSPFKLKYESIQEFNESIFSSVYRQAAAITKEIVEKNEEYHNNPRKKGNEYRNNEQIYNILSFVGNRGSGKTSCMLSFAEYLKDYHRLHRSTVKKNYDVGERALFIGINAIDAGLLEDKEDIIEVVLASLLGQFSKLENEGNLSTGDEYEFRRRDFNKCLQNLYNSNLRRKTDNPNPEFSSFNTLQEMSVSVNMRDNIKELIEKYIALIKQRYVDEEIRETDCYVLIPIDDIDMNITKGYEMLEQIRRYLMVPNVIILLSYKYSQLNDICNLYYINKLNNLTKIYDKEDNTFRSKITRLSNCYMAKVIPDGRRISIPPTNVSTVFENEEFSIIPVGTEDTLEKRKKDAHNVSKTFLRKIARCFSLRYPSPEIGMKIWQFQNLRDLCNLYNELHVLKDPHNQLYSETGENTKAVNYVYLENYEWLLEYIKHKASLELSSADNNILNELLTSPLEKLNQEIIRRCKELIKSKDSYYIAPSNFRGSDSYGTVLYYLNILSKKDAFSDLSAFIKAYLSAALGKLYFSEKANTGKKLWDTLSKDNIMGLYNKESFPSIMYEMDAPKKKTTTNTNGTANTEQPPKKTIVLGLEYIHDINSIQLKLDISNKELLTKNLKEIEIFYMFLNNLNWKNGSSEDTYIINEIEKCDFSIFNFIYNIYNYEQHLQSLHKTIQTNLSTHQNWTLNEEETYSQLNKEGLLNELREWENTYKTTYILPLHNVELMIYILKECEELFPNSERKTVTENSENKDSSRAEATEHINTATKKVIAKINDILKNVSSYYDSTRRSDDTESACLKDIFANCPVMKYILENNSLVPSGLLIPLDQSGNIADALEDKEDVKTEAYL